MDDPDLYISRDGGITWEETLSGSWGVNVADHGGLIVAARDYHQEVSTGLMYSCNEGFTWTAFQFSSVSEDMNCMRTASRAYRVGFGSVAINIACVCTSLKVLFIRIT